MSAISIPEAIGIQVPKWREKNGASAPYGLLIEAQFVGQAIAGQSVRQEYERLNDEGDG